MRVFKEVFSVDKKAGLIGEEAEKMDIYHAMHRMANSILHSPVELEVADMEDLPDDSQLSKGKRMQLSLGVASVGEVMDYRKLQAISRQIMALANQNTAYKEAVWRFIRAIADYALNCGCMPIQWSDKKVEGKERLLVIDMKVIKDTGLEWICRGQEFEAMMPTDDEGAGNDGAKPQQSN